MLSKETNDLKSRETNENIKKLHKHDGQSFSITSISSGSSKVTSAIRLHFSLSKIVDLDPPLVIFIEIKSLVWFDFMLWTLPTHNQPYVGLFEIFLRLIYLS